MEKSMGTENLKTLMKFIFLSLGEVLTIDKNGDGKLSISEGFSILTTLSFRFPEIYEAFPLLKEEWSDLDDAEREDLIQFFENELDLPMKHDRIEFIIKRTINAISYNYRYFRDMKLLLSVKK